MAAMFMLCKRSAPFLHLNATWGVGCCSLKATDGILGPWKNMGTLPWKTSPHMWWWRFLKQTFLEGKDILNCLKGLQQCFNLSQALLPFAYFLSFEESLGKTSRNWYAKTGSDSCISASPAVPAELPEHSSGLCLKSSLWPGVKLLILSLP